MSIINNKDLTDIHIAIKFVNESTSRIKWILFILIIASCLALTCFWNSLQGSWKHQRVETMKNYIKYLDNTEKFEIEKRIIDSIFLGNTSISNSNCSNNYDNRLCIGLKIDDSLCKYSDIKNYLLAYENLLSNKVEKPNFDESFLSDYYGKDILGVENLRLMYLVCWILEARDVRSFKIPFFDVSFDINDLGFIGGLGFTIILLIFYLSLVRGKENIKIAFKASELEFKNNYKDRRQFYYLLSMNQLIIMPHISNKKGKRYLKVLPLSLTCFPFIFSFCVFVNDILTSKYGSNFSHEMTVFEYTISAVFLIIIMILTTLCIWEFYLVDQLWKKEKIWIDNEEASDK